MEPAGCPALGWGGVAAAGVGGVLIVVLVVAPFAFLSDYPEDIRRAARAPTPGPRRAGVTGGIVFMIVLLASLGAVVFSWGMTHPGAGFFELALMAMVAIILSFSSTCSWSTGWSSAPGGLERSSFPVRSTALAGATDPITSVSSSGLEG